MSDSMIVFIAVLLAGAFMVLMIWIIATLLADLCEFLIRKICDLYYNRKGHHGE